MNYRSELNKILHDDSTISFSKRIPQNLPNWAKKAHNAQFGNAQLGKPIKAPPGNWVTNDTSRKEFQSIREMLRTRAKKKP